MGCYTTPLGAPVAELPDVGPVEALVVVVAGGGGGAGGGGSFRSDQPRTFYPAVCAACGASTEVPFEPRQGRPVYCRECYEANRETTSF